MKRHHPVFHQIRWLPGGKAIGSHHAAVDGCEVRACRAAMLRLAMTVASFLYLLLPDPALALDPGKDLEQYNYRTWSRQNGLPVNGINAITQTRDGYLWLGTSVGLLRFDGIEFNTLDLSSVDEVRSTIVASLASARDRGLWVGLENGAFGYHDGRSFTFLGKESWGQVNLDVHSLVESQDRTLWFATQNGVSRLTTAGIYENLLEAGPFQSTPNVLCAYEDRQGRLWFGTDRQGVFYWEAGEITRLTDPELDTTSVLSIAVDQEGQVWVGTAIGLYCYDTNFQRKEIPDLAVEIRALFVDQHGILWIGTSGSGVGRYQNGKYAFLQMSDGLAGNYVNALAEDREGSLWVGTRDGVSQLTDVKFPIHQAAEDPSVKDALAVAASQRGGVWIASPGGVTYFDGTAKTYGIEAGLPNRYVKRVFEAANGDVYLVSGSNNLVILSEEKAVAVYPNSTMVVGMAEDPQGVVVSVGGDLYRAGRDYFQPYAFKGEKPEMEWILNLATGQDGVIWVACANGIFRVKDGKFRHWSNPPGLGDPSVLWIHEDSEGVVWAGTLGGIVRLKDNELRLISRKHGLFDDNIYAIVPDDFGHLWVDSGRGIFRVSRQSMNDFAEGRSDAVECVAYDGLESVKTTDKTVQERVGCKSIDGRIWFPCPQGVVAIDPARIPTNSMAPPVHIDRVRANGQEVAPGDDIIVPPGDGEVEFSFDALTFIAPQKVQFRYRLDGFDKDWVEAGNRRMAYYTNLKPDRYTFRVIAANADGLWNESGDSLGFKLLPHFYQTVWFYVLTGGLLCAGLAGIYAWRVQHLKHSQLVLHAEVQNRTAELAKTNTSLHHEIEERKGTEAQLKQRTHALENEIKERKLMELEIARIHQELVDASRRAGMAEIATNVLHNVGNVLNSVNVSAGLVVESVKKSRASNLTRVVALLKEHTDDLGEFITKDSKGKQLPGYLDQLSEHLIADQAAMAGELDSLQRNVEHIKEIVAMQQRYATVGGVKEMINVIDLVEDSIRMNEGALSRHQVEIIREFQPVPPLNLEKHKILQILVNLVRNAKHACQDSKRADSRLTVRVAYNDGRIKISVSDNGVGISPENRTRVFNYGFTTKKDGHGFGLHSGALAAKEMGGSLTAHSDGPGQGATFTLELPCPMKENSHG